MESYRIRSMCILISKELEELCCVQVMSCFQTAFLGVLACLDGYMNIALEQTEEYVNGQLKNKYGDAFIRGNNGNKAVLMIPSK